MSRNATGSVMYVRNSWVVRVTSHDGVRQQIKIAAPLGPNDIDAARRMGAEISAKIRGGLGVSLARKSDSMTVTEYFVKWVASKPSAYNYTKDYMAHIAPILGHLHMTAVTRDDIESLVASLDAKIRENRIQWRTAKKLFSYASSMFDDASSAKDKTMRIIPTNPCIGVPRPDVGAKRSKQFLWPSEFNKLMACEDVPVEFRRAVAICIYTYTRLGELCGLRWEDVHLDDGYIHIHRNVDPSSGDEKLTKGAAKGGSLGRRVPIEPTILPLLRHLKENATGEMVVSGIADPKGWSDRLKRYITKAGITRKELVIASKTTVPLRWHDLRATGITWAIVRGDDPLKVSYRAHHQNFATTQEYIREAENLRGTSFGEPFPALPACLFQ